MASLKTAQIMPSWSADGNRRVSGSDRRNPDCGRGHRDREAPGCRYLFPGRASFSPNGRTVAIATIKPYTKRFREGTSSILIVDRATLAQKFYAPAPYESVTTRTEDGPAYSPDGKEMIFVMDDLLYAMPVDADGHPSGAAVKLNDEVTDAPSFSADSKSILYLSLGKLRLMDRATRTVKPVDVDLTWAQSKPIQKLLIHAARFWKGSGAEELKDVDVLITENRITSVTPHATTPPPV